MALAEENNNPFSSLYKESICLFYLKLSNLQMVSCE